MMDCIRFCLFYTILISVTSLFTNSYLYAEYDQTFRNSKRLSINISFRDFGEFLLYAIDSNGFRLLFTYSNKQININFNGHLFNRNVVYHPNSINNFEMLLKFEEKDLFRYIPQNPDPFLGFPYPLNYHIKTNKTYFWIGNIGPYVGEANKKYEPLKNPTFGCLHYLYINFKSLKYENYGDYFSKSCEQIFIETSCLRKKCSQISVKENFINCSFHAVNANKNCYHDLIEYDGQKRSFERIYESKYETTSLKFIWQQNISNHFCLIEVILKNKSSLLFYTNERNQIEMCFQRNLSEKCIPKILFNSTVNSTHVLLITFEYPQSFIKISDGKYIRKITEPFLGYITKFVIGFINRENICTKFEGKLAFRYDVSQFKSVCSQTTMLKFFKILFWIVLISIGIALILISICIDYCCCKVKQKKAIIKQSIEIYNLYEQGNIQERHLPTPPPLASPQDNEKNEYSIYAAVDKYEVI